MRKIVFVGGGSAKFVREVMVDLFSFEELQDSHITLMDTDAERVDRSARLVQKIIDDQKLPATVEATSDRRKALAGADYVLVTIMVGGYKHYYSDTMIPARFGVLPTVGDTIGPGGVFRTVRTAPVLRGIVEDLKEVAPDAYLLNYANPMAMNMGAVRDSGHARAVGLCHSIQHCVREIGRWLNVPHEEISYTAAGINHVDFYLTLRCQGRDLYPDLRVKAAQIIEQYPHERTRFELLEYLGHFPAEGPWHQSEYYPWFRKDQALVDHYQVETSWGYNVDSAHYERRTAEIEAQIRGDLPIRYQRSAEYAAEIIHSLETNTLRTFYGNVPNQGLIENLPPQAIVEVPCLVDKNGIFPCRMGTIPPQLAAVMLPHISVHEMAVRGTLTQNRQLIRQAVQADPLTGAVLTLPKIAELVKALFEENQEYVARWPPDESGLAS